MKVLHSEIATWLGDSTAIIDRVRKVARDVDRIVLVANADGVVVSRHADSPISLEILREGFAIGSILHEQRVGTNAIGTCIASRQAITVHADAHFNEAFRGFTCSAAPVFSPDGSILAAIDLSGRLRGDTAESNFAQHYIREAAQLISLLLFKKQHKNDCIITLSPSIDSPPLAAQELIAVDECGRIVGATPQGYACLGVPDLQSLAGSLVSYLCKENFSNIKPLKDHSTRLQTPHGTAVYATAFWPKKPVAVPVRTSADLRAEPAMKPLDQIAGCDASMQGVVRVCRKIVNRDIPLLLLGETGVGKDTLARAIHAESDRTRRPYVAVNCAAIPESLLASELFGYAPGTFTGGAKAGKTGKIAASDSGTLFLDEIGDMPIDLQAHLLRVLEERTVTPLGSTIAMPIDIKVICATHRDLSDLVNAGLFRKDLYYRIRGVQFTIPAVRHRTDLSALVTSVIQDEEKICGCSFASVSADAMVLLARYTWPGNIRELRNVIRYAASLHGNERELRIEHLPEYFLEACRVQIPHAATSNLIDTVLTCSGEDNLASNEGGSSYQSLRAINVAAERARIVHVLRASNWNINLSAEKLGISRSTLHRKIRQHSITEPNLNSAT